MRFATSGHCFQKDCGVYALSGITRRASEILRRRRSGEREFTEKLFMKTGLIFLALSCFPLVSQGASFYQNSYSIDLTGISSPVTNILFQEFPGTCCGQRMNFEGPDTGIAAASQVTTLDDPFLNGVVTSESFGIGVVQDLPGDADGQQHLVMFMSTAASALANGLDWGALFPTVDEDQTIADLQLATSGGDNWGNSFDVLAPGLDNSISFMNSLDSPGGLLGPGGLYTSPYFALPAPGDPATDFVVVAFSSGQIIGSGSVVQTAIEIGDAPEPSTFLPGFVALAALAWARRTAIRRQRS